MKLRDDIKELFGGKRVMFSMLSIEEERKFPDSPIASSVAVPVDSNANKMEKCYACQDDNTNWCWNCERPHCDKHAHLVKLGMILNTFCIECTSDCAMEAK